jgi:4-hydroxybenzoate polyprenyltransferase
MALMATELETSVPDLAHSLIGGKKFGLPNSTATSQERYDAIEKARRERNRALIVPREHGAWGLLMVPMVTGAGVAFRHSTNVFPLVLLLTAALAVFWLRTPLESLLGISAIRAETNEERNSVIFVVGYLGAIAALACAMLLWAGRNPLLWFIGVAAGLASVAQAFLRKMGRRTRMLSEVVGTIGLTSAAPAAFYVITGRFGPTAWMLWLANLIFTGNQIHYVQIRIHTARVIGVRAKLQCAWAFAAGQVLMVALLASACWLKWMPWFTLVAFAPLLLRGMYYFVQKPAPLQVRRLGWNELAQAIAFCILFVVSFTWAA